MVESGCFPLYLPWALLSLIVVLKVETESANRELSASENRLTQLLEAMPVGNEDGETIPGSYHQVEQNPHKIVADGLLAPVNGMYSF